jgi:hypothetical protein
MRSRAEFAVHATFMTIGGDDILIDTCSDGTLLAGPLAQAPSRAIGPRRQRVTS